MKLTKERFALGSYQYGRYSIDYFLDTAVELEIQHVELWAAAPQLCLDTITQQDITALRQQLHERELIVSCITPEQCNYPINLAAEEPALRTRSIEYHCNAIRLAQALDCPKILVTAGCGYYNHPPQDAWNHSADSLAQIAQFAKECGVQLGLETLTPASSNVLNTPEQQRDMLALLPSGSTHLVLDLGQMAHMKQDLSRYLAHGTSLGHVHIHDYGDAIHMTLGEGHLPLMDCFKMLEGNGYGGLYTFEINDPRYRMDPRQPDRQSVDWLKQHNLF